MTRPARLDVAEVDRALAAADSPWKREEDRLVLDRQFPTFLEAIAFVTQVAALAEEANHHPDIEVHYDRVRLAVSTHDAGGLTELDLALAEAVTAL